jgi:hypothetical protein
MEIPKNDVAIENAHRILKKYKDSNIISITTDQDLISIKPLSFGDIKMSCPDPLINLLDPWLPRQGIALIYAGAGIGKTLFTLNIAYMLARGGNFLKYYAKMPKKVLYIDGEMNYSMMHQRLMDIEKQQGALDEITQDNFFLLTPDKVYPKKLPKIDSKEGQAFYNSIIEECKIDVVFFDNFSTLSVFDENSPEEWKFLQDWFLDLKAKGLSIVGVHHSGKDRNGYRGTSKMIDCVDTAISLQNISENVEEEKADTTKKFKIVYQKNRTFGGQDSLPFEVTLSNGNWYVESVECNNIARILDMFNNLEMKQPAIAQELGVSNSYVYRIVRKNYFGAYGNKKK